MYHTNSNNTMFYASETQLCLQAISDGVLQENLHLSDVMTEQNPTSKSVFEISSKECSGIIVSVVLKSDSLHYYFKAV